MAPLVPHWAQPSHGEIQEVIYGNSSGESFATKSVSKISISPFGLFARMTFPPCTVAAAPTYATVQMGRSTHLSLNSDLVYINHSCEPSLLFDMPTLSILAGPRGLQPGDELTFFYPSTEWHMAQAFECNCGAARCRRRIAGAGSMGRAALEGEWLNGHVREMLWEPSVAGDESAGHTRNGDEDEETVGGVPKAGAGADAADEVEEAFLEMLEQARVAVRLAEQGLASYHRKMLQADEQKGGHGHGNISENGNLAASVHESALKIERI